MSQDEKVNFLKDLKCLLEVSGIDPDKICIVGSSSLAAIGMRQNDDIDLICKQEVRASLIKHIKQSKVCGKIEVVRKNWSFFDESITDSEIIENDEKHFLFCGIKFVSIDLLQKRKQAQNRPKDIQDLDKIRDYLDSKRNS